jgi:hypothetical protein
MSTEETRDRDCQLNIWPVLFLVLAASLLLISSSIWATNSKASTANATETGFALGDKWLDPYLKSKSLDDVFRLVSQDIRFDPYIGIMRGVKGTAIARRGNALDQALLLKHVLAQQGYQTRLATGRLDRKNALILLRGMYPPDVPTFNYSAEYAPFKLEQADRLIKTVSQHYWLEINQGNNQWLPLDPAFPRAKIGEAYARADKHYDQMQQEWQQLIAIRLLQTTRDKKTTTVFELELPVAELGYLPVSLSSIGIPLEKPKPKSGKGGSSLGLFGKSLDTSKTTKPETSQPEPKAEIQGTQYVWVLNLRGQGSRQSGHAVQFKKKGTYITREWLEITLKVPGQDDRHIERVLFDAKSSKPDDQPGMYRRFVLEVFPGSVSPELAEVMHTQFKQLPIEDWKKTVAASQKSGELTPLRATDEVLGSSLLQMILTRFAESSDEASDRAGYRNAVAVIRSTPRVLIASAELADNAIVFSMDLRLDEVDAIPFPGAPAKAARLFQTGRGILESTAEGEVLHQLTGKPVVTTTSLMTKAQAADIPLKVVDATRLNGFIKQARIPKHVQKTLSASVTKDREIIIPEKPVQIAGVDRWGWWQIEKASGHTVGVMDNGLHSSMTEYTISTKEINLDPRMGFVVGMIVGADTTLFAISGLMLKHGQVTPAMIKEAKSFLESVLCSSCPKAEASASASYSAGDDCFSVEKSVGVSAKVSIDFCEEYVNGFKCAAGMLMAGLTGESGRKEEVKVEASYSAGCKGGGVEAGKSRDY